ncbi:MAG: LysR family transcriptional regulator, partial [Tagaea sp.]|nr:LysR family transcriptional regulator [Tagaea sp.]
TPSALSKAIARLEARLGVRLLRRTTRSLALTPEGEAYYARARRIVADIREAENEVAGFRARPRGLLKINTGNAFGYRQLMPALPEFLARHPDLNVQLSFADKRVDLIESGEDVAVRTGDLGDDRLVERKIADAYRLICASPAYLARRGTPKRPEDLRDHDCVSMADMPNLSRWPFKSGPVQVSGPVTVDSANAVLEMGLAGVGVIRLGEFALADDVREGRLVPLLAEWHTRESFPISVVYPASRNKVPKTAAFVDFMKARFGHAPWRIA